jgi:hypothetical protein
LALRLSDKDARRGEQVVKNAEEDVKVGEKAEAKRYELFIWRQMSTTGMLSAAEQTMYS